MHIFSVNPTFLSRFGLVFILLAIFAMADVLADLNEDQKRQILARLKTEYEPDNEGDEAGGGAVGNEIHYDDRKLPSLVKFSGGKAKGEATYKKWKFEVKELIDGGCPERKIRRAMQKSLFGSAADSFMSVEKETSVNDILNKFDKLFQPSEDVEAIFSKFYSAVQESTESISDWYIRLESILDVSSVGLSKEQKENMIRSRFWKGLAKEIIRNGLRHKYDSGATAVELLNAARIIAEEAGTSAQHQSLQVPSNDQIAKLTSAIEKLTDRVGKLEGKVNKEKQEKQNSSNAESKKSSIKFRGKCHKCKRYGHKAVDCRVKGKSVETLNDQLSA